MTKSTDDLKLRRFVIFILKSLSGETKEAFAYRELTHALGYNWHFYMKRREIYWRHRLAHRVTMSLAKVLYFFKGKKTLVSIRRQLRVAALEDMHKELGPFRPDIDLSPTVLIFGPEEIYGSIENLSREGLLQIRGEGSGTVFIPHTTLWEVSI